MADITHTPAEKIETSIYAVIGERGYVRYISPEDLAEAIKLTLSRVRVYARTLAIEETEDRRAQYDETLLVDEWYDESDSDESAEDFAYRIWEEADAALERLQ